MESLREIEAKADAAQSAGNFKEAIALWCSILDRQPDWEHGLPHYFLADCYTRTGQLDLAEEAYRIALTFCPGDRMISAGLESFLMARKAGYIKDAKDSE